MKGLKNTIDEREDRRLWGRTEAKKRRGKEKEADMPSDLVKRGASFEKRRKTKGQTESRESRGKPSQGMTGAAAALLVCNDERMAREEEIHCSIRVLSPVVVVGLFHCKRRRKAEAIGGERQEVKSWSRSGTGRTAPKERKRGKGKARRDDIN